MGRGERRRDGSKEMKGKKEELNLSRQADLEMIFSLWAEQVKLKVKEVSDQI